MMFWLMLLLVYIGAAAVIWLLLPQDDHYDPTEHGDGEL